MRGSTAVRRIRHVDIVPSSLHGSAQGDATVDAADLTPIAAFFVLGLALALRPRAAGRSVATWIRQPAPQALLLFFLAAAVCDASAALGLGVALQGTPYALAAGFIVPSMLRAAWQRRRRVPA
jgi:hypothetical protein